jgi:hypothetical protein
MHRWRTTVGTTVGVAAVLGLMALATTPATARPLVPGRSVTATLTNHTPCTFQLTGQYPFGSGHVTQQPAQTIPPGGTSRWKVIGWSAASDPNALAIYVYTAQPGCQAAGESRGYLTANTDENGMSYRDDECSVNPAPLLRDTFSGDQAYHAVLSIDLTMATAKIVARPLAGSC